ncbi:MAG: hypothetical protein ACI88A_001667 [Paraglaciecola sp.]|jgi:hypothetical protein
MLDLILHDPVAWGSILGIVVVVVMAGYYMYLFIHNSNQKR